MEYIWVFAVAALLALAALVPLVAMRIAQTREMDQLRERYKRLVSRLETESLDARLSVDSFGHIRTINHRGEAMFKHPASEVIGHRISLLIPDAEGRNEADSIDCLYKNAKRTEDKLAFEVTGHRSDGSFFPMELLVSENGEFGTRKFYLTARDISDRQAASEHSKERRFLESVLHFSGAPVLVLNHNFRITHHNSAFDTISGYPFDEVQGRLFWELLLPKEEWPKAEANLRSLLATGRRDFGAVHWTSKSGKPVNLHVVATAIPGEEESARAIVMVGFPSGEMQQTPITPPSVELLERFASGIAAQLSEPLTSIGGYCDLLLQTLQAWDPARRDAEGIQAAHQKVAALAAQLLAFGRKHPVSAAVFNINEVITGLKPVMHNLLGEQIRLAVSLDNDIAPLNTDRMWVENLVLSLVVNAAESMPNGGTVSIETSSARLDSSSVQRMALLQEGRYVVLAVSDSSVTDPVQRARAFEPFPGGQQGMGLSAMLGVVRQCGGNAIVQAIPGSGTSIRVYLPVHTEGKGLFVVKAAGRS